MTDPVDTVRQALTALGSRIEHDRGHEFMAQCPMHADRTPSLHVSTGDAGQAVFHCFAGCTDTPSARSHLVQDALGLTWPQLFLQDRGPGTGFFTAPRDAQEESTQEAQENTQEDHVPLGPLGRLPTTPLGRRMKAGDLLRAWERHESGDLNLQSVGVGPMPENATADHERVARDIALHIQVVRAAGISNPVPYTHRWCRDRMGWSGDQGKRRASAILRDLRDAGTFACPPPMRGRNGMPGSTVWSEPSVVEQVVPAAPAVADRVEADGDVAR